MNRLAVTLFILALFGCANMGNDTMPLLIPVGMGNSMASDSIKQLQTLYPPAQTEFNIGQPVPKTDVFGTSLVFMMREKGYAVQEYNPTQSTGTLTGIGFQYSVDRPVSSAYTGLYRVKLVVGKAILTRAYTAKNNMTIPAGAWAKME